MIFKNLNEIRGGCHVMGFTISWLHIHIKIEFSKCAKSTARRRLNSARILHLKTTEFRIISLKADFRPCSDQGQRPVKTVSTRKLRQYQTFPTLAIYNRLHHLKSNLFNLPAASLAAAISIDAFEPWPLISHRQGPASRYLLRLSDGGVTEALIRGQDSQGLVALMVKINTLQSFVTSNAH